MTAGLLFPLTSYTFYIVMDAPRSHMFLVQVHPRIWDSFKETKTLAGLLKALHGKPFQSNFIFGAPTQLLSFWSYSRTLWFLRFTLNYKHSYFFRIYFSITLSFNCKFLSSAHTNVHLVTPSPPFVPVRVYLTQHAINEKKTKTTFKS